MNIFKEKRKVYNDWRDSDWYVDGDWYDRHSWFELKWFKHKLKRKLMDFVYFLYRKVERYLLSDFLFEMEFYTPRSHALEEYNRKHGTNHLGDYKCYLPIIIRSKNRNEAILVSNAIKKELENEHKITLTYFKISDKIISKEYFDQTIERLENSFKGYETEWGYIDIYTFTPQKTDIDFKIKYLRRNERKYFRMIRNEVLPFMSFISQNTEYLVKFYKTTFEE